MGNNFEETDNSSIVKVLIWEEFRFKSALGACNTVHTIEGHPPILYDTKEDLNE